MCDVVVAGGGPAGSVCARELARRGWNVGLIDRMCSASAGDAVPEILSPGGVAALERLGLKSALDGEASSTCAGILSYWADGVPRFRDRAGRILNRAVFDANLRKLAADAGVEVRAVERVALDDSARRASFFVETTGRRSAQRCGRIYFDRLLAMAFRASAGVEPDGVLWVAPSTSGWWYRANGTAVYLSDGDLIPRGPLDFVEHVGHEWKRAFGTEFSGELVQRRDARTSCSRSLWSGNWLTFGDAAFTVDPLSGSGLARAIRWAERAAAAIDERLCTGRTEGLAAFVVDVAREFAAAQASGQKVYAECAGRFGASLFWTRRV